MPTLPHGKKLDFTIRPLSWSSISQFRYDKEIWFKKYILGERSAENGSMRFGKYVGELLASDPTFLPEIERPEGGIYEYELRFKVGGVPVIGFIDWYHPEMKILDEYKTGKPWTKEKAENHGQLKLYSLGIMLIENIKPEDLTIRLHSMESEENNDFTYSLKKGVKPLVFPVKLTTKDCLLFGAELLKTVEEMEAYIHERTL